MLGGRLQETENKRICQISVLKSGHGRWEILGFAAYEKVFETVFEWETKLLFSSDHLWEMVTYEKWLLWQTVDCSRAAGCGGEGNDGGVDWYVDGVSGCGSYCFGGSEGIENCGIAGDKANDDESDCDDMLIVMTMTMIETVLLMLLKNVVVVMLIVIIMIILL